MIDKATILNGQINPALLYMSMKIQPTATDTSQIIAKYVPENKYAPQIPNICYICQLLYVHISDNYVSIYTSHKLTGNQ